jgi:YidC/Oxa1 family membrane protein insertase
MAAILMAYQAFFLSPPPEQPSPPGGPAPATQAPGVPSVVPGPAPPGAAPTVPAPPVATAAPPVSERVVMVDSPLYRARVSSKGGALIEWDLKYRGEKPMVAPGVVETRGVEIRRPGMDARPIAFAMATGDLTLGQETPTGQVRMVGEDGFGLRVTQEMQFSADAYVVEQAIRVENRQSTPQSAEIEITWSAPTEWGEEHGTFRGPRPISVVLLPRGAYWPRRPWITDAAPSLVMDGQWVGFESGIPPTWQNGVYLTAIIPGSPEMKVLEAQVDWGPPGPGMAPVPGKKVVIGVRAALPVLQPGQAWDGNLRTYLGPMELDQLTGVQANLDKAIYFGGFPVPESWAARWGIPTLPMEWVAVPVLRFMKWLYALTGNYGVAIIVLTIVTKLLFFPLSLKSMRSMKAMQAIQPQVNALRSKYKSDPQRLQRETMDLYRQSKVNPLGGCLPMVVQVPVFYALYVSLTVSPDLQNSPFICFGRAPDWMPFIGGLDLWICDLAALDPTYILPILMGVSMFVQQKMMPVMGDPRQAKMMLMMPIIFTFMFLSLPSGLVLYWTLSNVLQIGQQYYMDRGARQPARPAPARTANRKA